MQLIGDIALNGLYVDDESNNSQRINQLLPVLNKDDITFANLECPIYAENSINPFKKQIHTSSREATINILNKLGLTCVSLANNHIYDCKLPGLKKTIEVLDEIGVLHTGAGWKPEHVAPVIIDYSNKKIAFIAYVDLKTNPKTEFFSGEFLINYLDVDNIISDVNSLINNVDCIVCSLHWGEDYSKFPNNTQMIQARQIIDSGVNIIMGHHPHVLQPYEIYKNALIFYSLGGLTFGDYIKNGKLTALFRKTKTGIIVQTSESISRLFDYIITKEQKGNIILPIKYNYLKWSNRTWRKYHLAKKNVIYKKYLNFRERIIDRIFEYFFGYYKNPLKRLFQFRNLKKIKLIFKDLNNERY